MSHILRISTNFIYLDLFLLISHISRISWISTYFIYFQSISCHIFIYHWVFPRILINVNTLMSNSNIIFNILPISHDLHNDSKEFFLFVFVYFMRDIRREKDTEQSFCSFPYWCIWEKGFDTQFPSLMNIETAHLLCYYYYYLIDIIEIYIFVIFLYIKMFECLDMHYCCCKFFLC